MYDQGLALLFPTCTSCSDLWRNVLCAASFDPSHTDFVSAPSMKSFKDMETLARAAKLQLSKELAEQLFTACMDEASPKPSATDSRHTVFDAFGRGEDRGVGASKFAAWVGRHRLKMLRCEGLESGDICLAVPLHVEVSKEGGGLTGSVLKAANPELKIYDYCRTAKNDPNYLRNTAVQLVVPVGGLWLGWNLCTAAAALGFIWLTDSLIFSLIGALFGVMSRMGSASVATVAEQSSFDPGSVMFFLLPPIIMAEVRQQPSRSPLVR